MKTKIATTVLIAAALSGCAGHTDIGSYTADTYTGFLTPSITRTTDKETGTVREYAGPCAWCIIGGQAALVGSAATFGISMPKNNTTNNNNVNGGTGIGGTSQGGVAFGGNAANGPINTTSGASSSANSGSTSGNYSPVNVQ